MDKEVKAFFRGDKACKPHMYTYVKKFNTSVQRGLKFVSEGQYGAVYSGCIDDKCEKNVAIKITREPTAKMEYKIADKLKGLGVPDMYHFKSCKDGKDVLFFEYIEGQTLNEFLKDSVSREVYKSIMVQVLYNLYRIQKKFPTFRHHDLHGGNIIIRKVPVKDINISFPGTQYTINNSGVEPVIIDFGFSKITGIKNPLVESEQRKNIGIYKNSPKSYDVHYFLITIFSIVNPPSNEVQRYVRSFITKLLPPNYLIRESNKLKNMRLRGNVDVNHSKNVPNIEKILLQPFFTEKKSTYVLPSASVKPTIQIKKPIPPSNGKTALEKAKEVLAKGKIVGPTKKPIKKLKIPPPKPKSKTPPKPKSKTPPPPKSKTPPPPPPKRKVFMDKNGELKIDTRKCRLYTKDELCMIIKNLST
jgi:tRNA A-37 threonylcarbamoyl transferase component Bud32